MSAQLQAEDRTYSTRLLYAGEIENLEQAAYKQDIQFYAVEVSLILRRQNKKVELRILPTLIAEKAFGKLIAPHLFQLL